jgi:membrane-associated phospholipid phosphatase
MSILSLCCRARFLARLSPVLREYTVFLDRIVLIYTVWIALLVVLRREHVPGWPSLVAFHLLVIALVLSLPPRGARWEVRALAGARRSVRSVLRFLRHTYPLLLMIVYFEEVDRTVNALWPDAPYWFEPRLYALDRFLFGETPSILLTSSTGLLQDEVLHLFYLSYYFIVIGGTVRAWIGSGRPHPGPALAPTVTSIVTAFLLCFAFYPLLPARGPWENETLMSTLTPFEGSVFVPIVEAIIARGAVSGGCFPSSHVSASWATVFALAAFHRRAAWICAFFALGLSLACVYTRYHHGVDVPAGFAAGVAGAAIGRLTARERSVFERRAGDTGAAEVDTK